MMRAEAKRMSTAEKSEKRDQILKELRKLIAVKGIAGITMRDLASASGVTTMTLYNLFSSKDALLAETLRDAHRAVMESISSSTASNVSNFDYRDPLDSLIEYVLASAKFNLSEPMYSKATIYAYYSTDESLASFHRAFHDYFGGVVIRKYLEKMQLAGELNDWVSTKLLSRQIGESMFSALAEWARSGLRDDEFLDMALMGVLSILIGQVSPSKENQIRIMLQQLTKRLEPEAHAMYETRIDQVPR